MPTDETNGLYGPDGTLARFTAAAKGIHEVAEKLREQSIANRARLVREALRAAAADSATGADDFGALMSASECDDAALAKLGRLLK